MAKQRIALIFGGNAFERSVASVTAVADTLKNSSYEVVLLGITKKGKWLYYPGDLSLLKEGEWATHPDCCPVVFNMDGTRQGIYKILEDQTFSFLHIDCAIPVLYGQGIVDGRVQGLLKLASIPYVGNCTAPAAISLNTPFTRTIANGADIRTPRFFTVERNKLDMSEVASRVSDSFGYPVFVKPAGSLSAKRLAETEESLIEAIKNAFIHDKKVVIEERILGKLIKCAVIGNENPEASILGEIPLDNLDFPCKIPAELSQEVSYQIRNLAIKLYNLFDCSGLSGMDFFVTPADEIYFHQLNSIPDLFMDSPFVKLWETVGFTFEELLERLIDLAIEKAETIK